MNSDRKAIHATFRAALPVLLSAAFCILAGPARPEEPGKPPAETGGEAGSGQEAGLTDEDLARIASLPADLQRKIRLAAAGEQVRPLDDEEKLRLAALGTDLKSKVEKLFRKDAKEAQTEPKAPLKDLAEREKQAAGPETAKGKDKEAAAGKRLPAEQPAPGAEPAAGEKEAAAPSARPRRFGADLFDRKTSDFLPDLTLPVFDDYVVGPGDQLVVHFWNDLTDSVLTLSVSREGRVVLPKSGEIGVAGRRFSELEAAFREVLGRIHKDVNVSVTMGKLRSIQVYVVGELDKPGLYTISAVGTLLNALLATGGPGRSGSMRRIELRRDGKTVSVFDLYDMLLRGDKSADARLSSGDVVFIPVAGPQIEVAGEIARPALYEFKAEKTIADAISLAGGFTSRSLRGVIRVERTVEGRRREIMDVSGDPAAAAAADGDRIEVFAVDAVVRNSVSVKGSVVRPGEFEWREGMKVSDLLALAGGVLPGTYLGRADLLRLAAAGEDVKVSVKGIDYRPDREVIRVDLAAVLAGNPGADVLLRKMDVLDVLTLEETARGLFVRISGHVENPGTYPFREGMTVTGLLFIAQKALRPDTFMGRAEILRLIDKSKGYGFAHGGQKTPAQRETIAVDLASAFRGGADPRLMPFDEVLVYASPDVRPAPEATIIGAVRNPMTCELTESMRVSDMVFRAGGILKDAYLDSAEIVRRVQDSSAGRAEFTIQTIEFDLGKALNGDPGHNLLLENFDRIIIKKCADYFVKASIAGEVAFPGTYVMKKGDKLSDLVKRAGGYTKRAFLPGAFFTRSSIREIQEQSLKRFISEQKNKMLELETELSMQAVNEQVLRKVQSSIEARRRLLAELENTPVAGRLAIVLQDSAEFEKSVFNLEMKDGDALAIPEVPVSITLQGEVFNPGSVLFLEGKRLEYYVNLAGGQREGADSDRIYIVKADGSAKPRSVGAGYVIRWDSENLRWVRGRTGRVIERGDIIIIPPKTTVVSGYDLTKDIVDIIFKIAMAAGVVVGLF